MWGESVPTECLAKCADDKPPFKVTQFGLKNGSECWRCNYNNDDYEAKEDGGNPGSRAMHGNSLPC